MRDDVQLRIDSARSQLEGLNLSRSISRMAILSEANSRRWLSTVCSLATAIGNDSGIRRPFAAGDDDSGAGDPEATMITIDITPGRPTRVDEQ